MRGKIAKQVNIPRLKVLLCVRTFKMFDISYRFYDVWSMVRFQDPVCGESRKFNVGRERNSVSVPLTIAVVSGGGIPNVAAVFIDVSLPVP